MIVTAKAYTLNYQVSLAPDSCEVADAPVVNRAEVMPFPTQLLNMTHAQGSGSPRSVSLWGAYGLDRTHSQIFIPHPSIALDSNNVPFVFQQYFQGGNDADAALGIIESKNRVEWTGTRHNSTLTAFDTIREIPGRPGFFTGLSMQGLLWHMDLSGQTFTAAGRDMAPGVLPRTDGTNRRIVGQFPQGFWRGPTDFVFDPNDDHLIYVADAYHDRITVTDGHLRPPDGPVTTTWVQLPANFRPFSIEILDGKMFVAGRGLTPTVNGELSWTPGTGGLVAIDMATKAVTDISAGLDWRAPQCIRHDENGEMVIATINDMNLWRFNWQAGTRQLIHPVINPLDKTRVRPNLWVWVWIDKTGSCGPVGDVFYTSGGNNYGPVRIKDSHSGPIINTDPALPKFPQLVAFNGNGQCNSGMMLTQSRPGGGYGWALVGSDYHPIIIHAGVAGMSHRLLNYVGTLDGLGSNHPLNKYDEATRQRGENIWASTAAPSETNPAGLPSIALLHGYMGESGLDIKHVGADGTVYPAGNAEQLLQMPWAERAAFLRAGSGGTRPRPTLTDDQIKDVTYYLKTMSMHFAINTKVDPIGHTYPWIYPPAAPYFAIAIVNGQDVMVRWRHAEPTRVPAVKYVVTRHRVDAVEADVSIDVPITDASVVDHVAPGRYRYHVYSETASGLESVHTPVPFDVFVSGGTGTVSVPAPAGITIAST